MPTVVVTITQESIFLAPVLHEALSRIVPDVLRTKRHPLKSGSINFHVNPNLSTYQSVDILVEVKGVWDLARWFGARKRTAKIRELLEDAIANQLGSYHTQSVAVELHLSMAAYSRSPW